ncbi:MAG: ABC transporter permease subunit [Chloroflexota bacterium]|nr:ABC transporter permease subunit [Chloroflexota bacterium]
MSALLRADWLRFRRRKDFWIIAIGVCLFSGISFLAAYRSDAADPTWFSTDPVQIRQEILSYAEFGGMTQAEIDAQIDQMVTDQVAAGQQQSLEWEAQQRITLQKYDVSQSVFTILGSGLMPMLALILGASLAVGDEFRFGTVRTSLLAAGNRRRFLGARLVSLFAISVGLFAILALIGVVLGLGLRIVGAELAPVTTPIDPLSALQWLAAQVLTTMVLIALAVALTFVLRSGALPLLLILIAALVELFVANLPIFGPGEFLAGVPQGFLTTSIRTLTTVLGYQTHAVALADAEVPTTAIDLPLVVVAGIIAAWGLLFLVIADRRFRSMDVVE